MLKEWEDPRTLTNYGFLVTELGAHVDEVIGWYERSVAANHFNVRGLYYLAGEYLRRKKDNGIVLSTSQQRQGRVLLSQSG